ncbi:MAG: hypothetical protein NXH95_12410 [Pseudomonadaceae bacterium]|nr:hypothetical protein [Pseudomonadaceae bacterium]
MSEPTDFNKFRKKQRQQRGKDTTLCRSGFHKWVFSEKKQFDVKQGKLISIQRCERCQLTRTKVS